MPSVSTNLEIKTSPEVPDPVKQAITIVEKKVRNLEKRKGKLDCYKIEIQEGKDLNNSQKAAVQRYDEVVVNLEFAKELHKQFVAVATENIKFMKKKLRQEQLERAQLEQSRIREILKIQEVLNSMGADNVRQDFLGGKNGAVQLTEAEMNQLDEIFRLISPTREVEDGMPTYQEQMAAASSHLVSILDGKSKEVVGTTYKDLQALISRVYDCSYFDKTPSVEAAEETLAQEDGQDNFKDGQELVIAPLKPVLQSEEPEAGPVTDLSEGIKPQIAGPVPAPEPTAAPHVPPAVDNSFFSTTTTAFPNQQRPLNEVINSVRGNFNFLQESQIDMESPHMDPAVVVVHSGPSQASVGPFPGQQVTQLQKGPGASSPPTINPHGSSQGAIPSQTFTNQNFTVQGVGGSQAFKEPRLGIQGPQSLSSQLQPQTSHLQGQGVSIQGFQSGTAAVPGQSDSTPNPPPPIPLPVQSAEDATKYMNQLNGSGFENNSFVATQTASSFTPQQQQHQSFSQQTHQPAQTFGNQDQATAGSGFGTQQQTISGQEQSTESGFAAQQDTFASLSSQQQGGFIGQTEEINTFSTQTEDTSPTSSTWGQVPKETEGFGQQDSGRFFRGGRGGRGRGASNGFSGRSRGGYQPGRGGYNNYRGNQEGNSYYQNAYRDNLSGNYNSGFRRGGGNVGGSGRGLGGQRGSGRGGPRGSGRGGYSRS